MCVRAKWLASPFSGVAAIRTMRALLALIVLLFGVSAIFANNDQEETAEATAAKTDTPKADEAMAQAARTGNAIKEAAKAAVAKVKAAEKEMLRMIGATTLVTEMSTGLPLPARVDTGATCCSIHCQELVIKDAHPDPKVNIGKPVRFLIPPLEGKGKGEWIESKIVDHVKVRTSEREDERYKVRLKLKVDDVEKKVLVTLNDREKMKYPMLLGRNFLADDFLVNVSLKGDK
jgi:hypothetical protein